MNLKYGMNLPVIHTGCSAGQTLYINAQGRALPCYILPPVSEIAVDMRNYMKYWDVLNESAQHAVIIFEPFVDFAMSHDHRNFTGCESCPDLSVCRRCPLISISDPEALKRCQMARDRIVLLRPEYDHDDILKIKPTVKHKLSNNTLTINIKDGSYKCEKTYELESFAKSIWNEVVKNRSMRQINEALNDNYSELSAEERRDALRECIDYFLKEGIITIN